MSLTEALGVLGVVPGTPLADVRLVYRSLVRRSHPDLRHEPDATARTARITAAFATVRAATLATGGELVPAPAPTPPSASARTAAEGRPPTGAPGPTEATEADTVDGDTIAITVPPSEAFALLLDAAARVGSVGYVDRQLGLLEVLVRFEGGPTCSVLCTLQGRAFVTEVFCTMDSIEAAPAPPLRPVVEALVDALRSPG
ncbi:hypothetical protein [Rhabdothermincola salaria]|uniref:hypothetical protein n=1 Tax=Rhabdothermincola salaria TaxID=2903142 RepID=UPI001E630F0D|nr:hypothetical protein [Rhabdothermincola salaria]MCD9622987.1 hypothetical protein [Rhabdothermincola salaria]